MLYESRIHLWDGLTNLLLGNLSRDDRSLKIAYQISRITCFRQTCDVINIISMPNMIKNCNMRLFKFRCCIVK